MYTLSTQQLHEMLHRRYSVKQFDPTKKIDPILLNTILDTFHLSPSSGNLQPRGCVVVTDPEVRAQLQTHSYCQSQVVDASHLLVLCRRTVIDESWVDDVIDTVAGARGLQTADLAGLQRAQLGIIAREGDDIDQRATNQVFIALGAMLTACAALGVDACPIGGFDAHGYNAVLHLADKHLASAVVLPIGYRSDDDKYATAPKARLPKEGVIFFE